MRRTRQETARVWRERIEAAKSYQGTAADYCRSAGINSTSFYLWRIKLRRESAAAFVPAVVAYETVEARGRDVSGDLPDPKWLGEVLSSMLRSLK